MPVRGDAAGTAVALVLRNSFHEGARFMFTAIAVVAVVGVAFAWLKVRHKRKAAGAN
jgi:hypothetical protein